MNQILREWAVPRRLGDLVDGPVIGCLVVDGQRPVVEASCVRPVNGDEEGRLDFLLPLLPVGCVFRTAAHLSVLVGLEALGTTGGWVCSSGFVVALVIRGPFVRWVSVDGCS